MSRLTKPSTVVVLAGAFLALFMVGAGLAFVGHLLLEGAWTGLGLHPVVFPDSR